MTDEKGVDKGAALPYGSFLSFPKFPIGNPRGQKNHGPLIEAFRGDEGGIETFRNDRRKGSYEEVNDSLGKFFPSAIFVFFISLP